MAVGVIEAKPVGTTLSGVAEQSEGYVMGIPDHIPHLQEPLPFAYESTGEETFFRDLSLLLPVILLITHLNTSLAPISFFNP